MPTKGTLPYAGINVPGFILVGRFLSGHHWQTGRLTQYKFTVGTTVGSNTDTGTMTWNQNGSLATLGIVDQIPGTHDTQTCNFTHDDLARISSADCGSSWNQQFTYDAFGNITKTATVGTSFQPTYSTASNWITGLPGVTPTTDADGHMTYDGTHTYGWDAESKMVSLDTTTVTYDALSRMVEKAVSSAYTQVVYSPLGRFALMNGQTLQKAFISLPTGAQAVYTSSGLGYYRHHDHLGSSRLASTPSRTLYSSTAYAAFGETYSQVGTTDLPFTGQDQDTVPGIYDFLFRKYASTQGRWLSPDPAGLAAANPASPQSWNRYACVGNTPLNSVDPLGLFMSVQGSCAPGFGWSYAPDGELACTKGLPNPFEFECPPWLVMDPFSGACVAPLPVDPPGEPSAGNTGGGAGGGIAGKPGNNTTCPSVPQAPPGADIDRNIRTSQWMQVLTYTDPSLSLYVFKETVGNKRPWDYKQQGWTLTDTGQLGPSPFQDFGNFNFGATGAAWGIPLDVLLRGAGYAQTAAGTSTPEWGHWYQGPPYGDDPNDQALIIAGYQYYKNGCYQKN